MSSQERRTFGAFSDRWNGIVKARVILFGGSSVLIFAVALVGYLRGMVSARAVAANLLFSVSNILISKASRLFKIPSRAEALRLAFNSVTLPFVYLLVDGSYSPFWFPYSFMCLSVATTSYLIREDRYLCHVQIAYWVAHFAFFSWWFGKFPDFYSFSVIAATLAVPALYLVHLMHLLHESVRTEREQAQALTDVQAKIAVSAKLSSLGEMAGGVAHEINTPLAVIKVVAEQAREILEDEKPDLGLLRESAARVEEMTNRIASIVTGLRTFSRDGSRDPFREVKVTDLIETTLSLCREKFSSRGICLEVEDSAAGLAFEGRSVDISQVLLNLLNNACDAVTAAGEGGSIRVAVAERNDGIEIRVTDSGPGVSEESRKKLFQPFFTTKEIGKGVGLGLSISLGIAKSHGGELYLDAQVRQTSFVIRLPKKQTPAALAA